ncbi:MAG: L,D-transpeptidase family protein [Novosphingobium sp.]
MLQKKRAASGYFLAALGLVAACPVQAQSWTIAQVQVLRQFAAAAPEDALPAPDTQALDAALRGGPGPALDTAATDLALRLARLHLLGAASAQQKAGWRIADTDQDADVAGWLERSLAGGSLATFFTAIRPSHPDYAALRTAFAREADPARKQAIALNMERWRWLPRTLGESHVLVNIPTFEARLWRDGKPAGSWPVIVGKLSTPTPIFSAMITGVNLNPWWNIPASIEREKRGRFPASQGYVRSGGQWRQKPGPNNALGQMKLVMPNPYSVYMHDTPARNLFANQTRAYSHGCIRTGDAIGFAATLLEGSKSREEIDAVVQARTTVTFNLARPLPVYVAYFTATPAPDGSVTISPDLYGRDATTGFSAPPPNAPCGA